MHRRKTPLAPISEYSTSTPPKTTDEHVDDYLLNPKHQVTPTPANSPLDNHSPLTTSNEDSKKNIWAAQSKKNPDDAKSVNNKFGLGGSFFPFKDSTNYRKQEEAQDRAFNKTCNR